MSNRWRGGGDGAVAEVVGAAAGRCVAVGEGVAAAGRWEPSGGGVNRGGTGNGPPEGEGPPECSRAAHGAHEAAQGSGGPGATPEAAGSGPEAEGPRAGVVEGPAGGKHGDGGKGTVTGLDKSSKNSKAS